MIIDGYIRVSTEEQARDGVSLDAQPAKIRAYHSVYGQREGYEFSIGETFVDAGVSAKTLKRPALTAALERLDRGESQGLIVSKLDRLTRDLGDWQALIRRYFGEKAGRRLIAVDNEVNTMTANGRMMLNMIVMIAQWERETISERTREGLAYKISRGERCGKVRYGHRLGPDGKTLIRDEQEQHAIGIMKALRDSGRSLRSIGTALQEYRFPTRDGKGRWTPGTIAKILKRESA